jgi:hypothetical protein
MTPQDHHLGRGERVTRPKTGQKPGTGTGPQRPDQGEPARGGRRAGATSARPSRPTGQAAEATRTQLGPEAFGLATTGAHVRPRGGERSGWWDTRGVPEASWANASELPVPAKGSGLSAGAPVK